MQTSCETAGDPADCPSPPPHEGNDNSCSTSEPFVAASGCVAPHASTCIETRCVDSRTEEDTRTTTSANGDPTGSRIINASPPRTIAGLSGSLSRHDERQVSISLSPDWCEASYPRSLRSGATTSSPVGPLQTPGSPLIMPLSDPELGEGTGSFDEVIRHKLCQGPNCPLACCSREDAYLVNVLHAVGGVAATSRDFHSPSSTSRGGPQPPAQQQQANQQLQLHQHANVSHDKGSSAVALPPSKVFPRAPARISNCTLQSNCGDMQVPLLDESHHMLGAHAMAVATAGKKSSKGEGQGTHGEGERVMDDLPTSVQVSVGALEDKVWKTRDLNGPVMLLHERERDEGMGRTERRTADSVEEVTVQLKSGGGEPFCQAFRESAEETERPARDEQTADFSKQQENQGEPVPSDAGDQREPSGIQQREHQEQPTTEEDREAHAQRHQRPREVKGSKGSWSQGDAVYIVLPPRGDVDPRNVVDPWEITYEGFVQSHMKSRRRASSKASKEERCKGELQRGNENFVSAAASSHVQNQTSAPCRCKAGSTPTSRAAPGGGDPFRSQPAQARGAHWSQTTESFHPIILPPGTDLVTYVQTENGKRREQHALYYRKTGTFERGNMNFSDIFGFIQWVHAEGGASSFWESSKPDFKGAASDQTDELENHEVDESDIDDAFDPDDPPERTFVSDVGFRCNGFFPWQESQEEGEGRAGDEPIASAKLAVATEPTSVCSEADNIALGDATK